MSRKGENIYKRKDGRWEGRYILSRTADGKAKYGYIYAYTYMDCKQKLIYAKANREDLQTSIKSKSDSLNEVAKHWLRFKTPQIKPATLAKYSSLLESYIFPNLGNKPIAELSSKDIRDFSYTLLLEGAKNNDGLSTKTVSDIISLLRIIIRYANENGYKVSTEICNLKIKQEQKPLQIFSKEQQQQLFDYLVNSEDLRDIGILLSLFTGIRIGELCALKWDNISLENGIINICSTLQRIPIVEATNSETTKKTKIIIAPPKSACSIRIIPLPEFILDILGKIECKQGFLLTSKENQYVEPRSMQYHFKKVLKDNSIDELNFHALRHTFATRCVELGFDVKSLSEILGHASVSITMNRYVHPSFDLKRENMKRLSELLSVN